LFWPYDLGVQHAAQRIWHGVGFLHVERAELARLTGDEAARERELREAHRLFMEIDAPIRAEQVAKELAG
jgi:hypothetical protein